MTALLVVAGIAWLFASFIAVGRIDRTGVLAPGLVLPVLGPLVACLIIFFAYQEGRAGGPNVDKTRVTLREVQARLKPESPAFSIGGNPERDDVVEPGLPAGFITFWAATATGAKPANDRGPACPLPAPEARSTDLPVHPPGAAGAGLCLGSLATALPAVAIVELDGVPADLVPVGSIEVCRGGCSAGAADRKTSSPEKNTLYLPAAVARPDPRFAYYWVDRSKRAYARPAAARHRAQGIPVHDGTTIVARSAAPLRAGEVSAALDDSQAWTVSWSAPAISLRPDPPELILSEPGPVAFVTAAEADAPAGDSNLRPVRTIGARFSTLLAGHQLILPGAAVGQTYIRSDAVERQANDRVLLSQGDRGLLLRIEPLTISEGLPRTAKWAAILILIAGGALTWRIRWRSAVAAAVLGVAETFLTLRLLIAIEGWIVDGSARTIAAVPQAMVALPLGVMVVTMALARSGERLRPALGFVVLGGASLIMVARIDASLLRISLVEAAILSALAVAALLCTAALPIAARWCGGAARKLMGLKLAGWTPGSAILYAAFTLAAALAILGARYLSLGIGREAVMIGTNRFAFSIVFVPLTLLASAVPLVAIARARSAVRLALAVASFGLFAILGAVLPNWLADDGGAALVLAVALVVAAALALASRPLPLPASAWLLAGAGAAAAILGAAGWIGDWPLWWGPLLIMTVVCLALLALAVAGRQRAGVALFSGLCLWPVLSLGGLLLWIAVAASRPPGVEIASEPPPALGRTEARIMAVINPSRFAAVMSREAVRIRSAEVQLRDYAAPIAGRGYLNLLPPVELRRQQFTDYGAAIHLISPFGRLAAAGLLLILSAASIVIFALPSRVRSLGNWAGAAAWTGFATTCAYIVLANVLAAPFTGRNVYLLASNSLADLIEGLLLLALAGGLLRRRVPE